MSSPILALYDQNRETKINADASSYGIGGVVLQKQDDGKLEASIICFQSTH